LFPKVNGERDGT